MTRHAYRTVAVFALLTIFAASCAPRKAAVPVGKFQSAVEKSSATLAAYYWEINTFETDVYFEERLIDKDSKIFTVDRNRKPTPVIGRFSIESIQARIDALTLLGIYGDRLAELGEGDQKDPVQVGGSEEETVHDNA